MVVKKLGWGDHNYTGVNGTPTQSYVNKLTLILNLEKRLGVVITVFLVYMTGLLVVYTCSTSLADVVTMTRLPPALSLMSLENYYIAQLVLSILVMAIGLPLHLLFLAIIAFAIAHYKRNVSSFRGKFHLNHQGWFRVAIMIFMFFFAFSLTATTLTTIGCADNSALFESMTIYKHMMKGNTTAHTHAASKIYFRGHDNVKTMSGIIEWGEDGVIFHNEARVLELINDKIILHGINSTQPHKTPFTKSEIEILLGHGFVSCHWMNDICYLNSHDWDNKMFSSTPMSEPSLEYILETASSMYGAGNQSHVFASAYLFTTLSFEKTVKKMAVGLAHYDHLSLNHMDIEKRLEECKTLKFVGDITNIVMLGIFLIMILLYVVVVLRDTSMGSFHSRPERLDMGGSAPLLASRGTYQDQIYPNQQQYDPMADPTYDIPMEQQSVNGNSTVWTGEKNFF